MAAVHPGGFLNGCRQPIRLAGRLAEHLCFYTCQLAFFGFTAAVQRGYVPDALNAGKVL